MGPPATTPPLPSSSAKQRWVEILAYSDTGVFNGPVEAIKGRLEHLRGIALRFRNSRHYILRSLIHPGELQAKINALQIVKSPSDA